MSFPTQEQDRSRLWSIDVMKQTQLNGNRITDEKVEVDATNAESGSQGSSLTCCTI